MASRLLAIPVGIQVWIVLLLVSPVWLYQTFNFYLLYGLVAFASASFLAPLVLASFLKFLDRSCFKILREIPPLFVGALFPSRLGASGRCAARLPI